MRLFCENRPVQRPYEKHSRILQAIIFYWFHLYRISYLLPSITTVEIILLHKSPNLYGYNEDKVIPCFRLSFRSAQALQDSNQSPLSTWKILLFFLLVSSFVMFSMIDSKKTICTCRSLNLCNTPFTLKSATKVNKVIHNVRIQFWYDLVHLCFQTFYRRDLPMICYISKATWKSILLISCFLVW